MRQACGDNGIDRSGCFQDAYLSQWLHTLGSSRFREDAVLIQQYNKEQMTPRHEFEEMAIFLEEQSAGRKNNDVALKPPNRIVSSRAGDSVPVITRVETHTSHLLK